VRLAKAIYEVTSTRGKTSKTSTRTKMEILQQFKRRPMTPPEWLWPHSSYSLT
jgi:hypothetical protein